MPLARSFIPIPNVGANRTDLRQVLGGLASSEVDSRSRARDRTRPDPIRLPEDCPGLIEPARRLETAAGWPEGRTQFYVSQASTLG